MYLLKNSIRVFLIILIALNMNIAVFGEKDSKKKRIDDIKKMTNQTALVKIAQNNSDPDVREAAVKNIKNQSILKKIAQKDKVAKVRLAAVYKINDQKVLTEIAFKDKSSWNRREATSRITSEKILTEIAINSLDLYVIKNSIKKIQSQNQIINITLMAKTPIARLKAFKMIDNPEPDLIIKIAKTDFDSGVGELAVEKINDQQSLEDIAKNAPAPGTRCSAIKKISNKALLLEIAKSDPSLYARRLAAENFRNYINPSKYIVDTKQLRLAEKAKSSNMSNNSFHGSIEVSKITDQLLLEDIALNAWESEAREFAVKKLKNQALLAKIAKNTSGNPFVRKKAVQALTDPEFLFEIAKNCLHAFIREEAAEKINDQAVLSEIVKNDPYFEVRATATNNISDPELLALVANNDPSPEVRLVAVEKIKDKKILTKLAKNDPDSKVRDLAKLGLYDQQKLEKTFKESTNSMIRLGALKRLKNQEVLAEIVNTEKSSYRRELAVNNITDQTKLISIAKTNSYPQIRKLAINTIKDRKALETISQTDKVRWVQYAAKKRLQNLYYNHFNATLLDEAGIPLAEKTIYFLPLVNGKAIVWYKKGTKIIISNRRVKGEYANPYGVSSFDGKVSIPIEPVLLGKYPIFTFGFINNDRAELISKSNGKVLFFTHDGSSGRIINLGEITVKLK